MDGTPAADHRPAWDGRRDLQGLAVATALVVAAVAFCCGATPGHTARSMATTRDASGSMVPGTARVELFTADTPVDFAFHGYQRAVHEIVHGRVNAGRFHVRGFNEHGTTTTPFDMVVLNGMSRYHLAREAQRRTARTQDRAPTLIALCENLIARAVAYSREHLEDPPEIRD